jgi:DNA repair exonuclease SbcCD ATPase subunit
MELEINNFKNISQKNIKLDYQLYLFKGVSGSGKSTILEAIKFVLYGASRNAKSLSKKGKTSVKLKYQDIEITRSKNPEFLILKRDGKDFQNSEAQNIINQKFYTEKIWYLGSYIPQNKRNIFLDSNSQEKLEILKELIFKENKDSNLKFFHLLDDLSKCFLDKIKNLDGKIEYLEKDLERLKNENSEYLEIYPQAKEIENLDDEIIRLGEKLKIHLKLEDLRKQNIDLKEVKRELENNYPPNLNLETINLWKEYIQNGEDLKDFQVKEYDIEALEKELYIVKNNQMIEEKFSTKDIPSLIENTKREIEMISCKKKLEKINKLRDYLSSLENQSLNLDNLWRNLLETINHKYRNYNKYLGEIIISTYLSKKRKSYSCPCCNNNLYLENETLKTTNVNLTDKEKEEFKGVIKNLEIYNSYKSEAQRKIEILEKEIPKDFENKKFKDLMFWKTILKFYILIKKPLGG